MNLEAVFAYFDARILIDQSTGCWNWVGPRLSNGYGSCHIEGIKTTAHRAQFWLFNGKIERGHEIHHKCHNPSCVNLDHLESLSIFAHSRVSAKAMQTHCVHGHEFSLENTYYKVSNNTRVCRKCAAIRQRENRSKK